MIACWAVGAIIAFATGYQLSTNDLAREKVVELCEMEKGFYDQLLNQMGTDLTKGLFTSHAIVESVISGAVSSFTDKVAINLRWINDHLADLKPMANDWLNQIKTKFFASDVSSHVLNFEELGQLIGSDYYTGFYSFDNWNYYDFVNSIYSGVFHDNDKIALAQDALAGMFYLAYDKNNPDTPDSGGGFPLAFKKLHYSSNFNESIIKDVVVHGDTILLKCSQLVKGAKVRYAVNGQKGKSGYLRGARGNLRDSQCLVNAAIVQKKIYPMHNWCYQFDILVE